MENGHEKVQVWTDMARDYARERRYGENDRLFDALIDRISKASVVAARIGKDGALWGMLQRNVWRGLSMEMALSTDGSGQVCELTRLMTAHSIDQRNRELWELLCGCEAENLSKDFGVWEFTPENGLYWEAAARMGEEVIRYSEHVLGVLGWSLGGDLEGATRREALESAMEETRVVFGVLLELAPPVLMISICGIFYRNLYEAKKLKPGNSDDFGRAVAIIAGAARDMLQFCGESL